MELLHRHPLEVNLPPWAFAQLQAYRELHEQDLCNGCRKEALQGALRRTCEQCGKPYNDSQIQAALEHI